MNVSQEDNCSSPKKGASGQKPYALKEGRRGERKGNGAIQKRRGGTGAGRRENPWCRRQSPEEKKKERQAQGKGERPLWRGGRPLSLGGGPNWERGGWEKKKKGPKKAGWFFFFEKANAPPPGKKDQRGRNSHRQRGQKNPGKGPFYGGPILPLSASGKERPLRILTENSLGFERGGKRKVVEKRTPSQERGKDFRGDLFAGVKKRGKGSAGEKGLLRDPRNGPQNETARGGKLLNVFAIRHHVLSPRRSGGPRSRKGHGKKKGARKKKVRGGKDHFRKGKRK